MTRDEKIDKILKVIYDKINIQFLLAYSEVITNEPNKIEQEPYILNEFLLDKDIIKNIDNGMCALTHKGYTIVENGGWQKYQKVKDKEKSDSITLSKKKEIVLKFLYNNRFDGRLYDVATILHKESEMVISSTEAQKLAQSLYRNKLIRAHFHKDGASAEITDLGIEYIENKLEEFTYNPKDKFSEKEQNEVLTKVDELKDEIEKLRKGQEILYDDLIDELEELKELIKILGKKDFFQLLKGKFVDAGLGTVSTKGFELILSVFKEPGLLD